MKTEKELSIRIHYDWYHKCRTCKHWDANRNEIKDGNCNLHKIIMGIDDRCNHWDSYDIDTAIEVLDGKWDYLMNPRLTRDC